MVWVGVAGGWACLCGSCAKAYICKKVPAFSVSLEGMFGERILLVCLSCLFWRVVLLWRVFMYIFLIVAELVATVTFTLVRISPKETKC